MQLSNMCTTSHLKTITKKNFQLGCFAITLYMIYKQFKLFVDNEDSSSISYRKFNDEDTDLYPTFSFCFDYGLDSKIFKERHFLAFDDEWCANNGSCITNGELYLTILAGDGDLDDLIHGCVN